MNEKNNKIKLFNKDELIYKLLIIVSVVVLFFLVFKIVNNYGDVETFKTVSKKPFKEVSNKDEKWELVKND